MIASIVTVGAVSTLMVLAALQGWVMLQVRGQQRRVQVRLTDLAQRRTVRVADSEEQERDRLFNALAGHPARPFEWPSSAGGGLPGRASGAG